MLSTCDHGSPGPPHVAGVLGGRSGIHRGPRDSGPVTLTSSPVRREAQHGGHRRRRSRYLWVGVVLILLAANVVLGHSLTLTPGPAVVDAGIVTAQRGFALPTGE